ncbi:MAG: hypothetical protein K2O18_15150 [Oscillospiraceae bacterium]|nr:hypothetical protein [Oscillospiraceae bacterium]
MNTVVYGAVGPKGEERMLSRRLLQTALTRECGLHDVPAMLRAEKGKPYFPDFPGIHFNLSHSHGAAVCALSGAPVGVDVEVLRPAPRRLSGGLSDEEFFRLWTAQEATVKYSGEGIHALIERPVPDPRCRVLENFLPGCIVTVCPADADAEIRVVQLTGGF